MPPTVSHWQVQKELELCGLGRLDAASLRMFAVRSLRQRVSLIVMPMIEQSDERPVSVRRRAVISRTHFATEA